MQLALWTSVGALALGFAGGLGIGHMQTSREVDKIQLTYTLEKAQAVRVAQQAERTARDEEQRRISKLAESVNVAHAKASQARADASSADRVADELRHAYLTVAASLGRGCTDPAIASSSSSTTGPGLVFADLFSRGDQVLRQCAAALDQAYIAGKTCEQSYDSLIH